MDNVESDGTGLQFVGPEPGRWLQEHMTGFGGIVDCVVPGSFPFHARVLHRIDPTGDAVRWSDVCAATGAVAHPLMQWERICTGWHGPVWDGGRSSDVDPEVGNLDTLSMTALYGILSALTIVDEIFHACWIGWGAMPGWVHAPGPADPSNPPVPLTSTVRDRPLLHLPHREYLVYAGTLDPAQFVPDPDSFWPQSPSLSWPADQTWCVATEIDFDSTLVAGSAELIAAVLAHPDLEAWPVSAGDSLESDGDLVNGHRSS